MIADPCAQGSDVLFIQPTDVWSDLADGQGMILTRFARAYTRESTLTKWIPGLQPVCKCDVGGKLCFLATTTTYLAIYI